MVRTVQQLVDAKLDPWDKLVGDIIDVHLLPEAIPAQNQREETQGISA